MRPLEKIYKTLCAQTIADEILKSLEDGGADPLESMAALGSAFGRLVHAMGYSKQWFTNSTQEMADILWGKDDD